MNIIFCSDLKKIICWESRHNILRYRSSITIISHIRKKNTKRSNNSIIFQNISLKLDLKTHNIFYNICTCRKRRTKVKLNKKCLVYVSGKIREHSIWQSPQEIPYFL